MDLENMLKKPVTSYILNIIAVHLYEKFRRGNSTETGSKLMVAQGWGELG